MPSSFPRALRLLALAALIVTGALLLVGPSFAGAAIDPLCGQTLDHSIKLKHDFVCDTTPAITVVADGITIDLNGKTISGPYDCCGQPAIYVGDHSNVTVTHGTFIGYSFAVGLGPDTAPDVPFLFGPAPIHGAPIVPSGGSNNVVSNITLANNSEMFAGYDEGGVHNTFTQIHGGEATGGVILSGTQSDTLSNSRFGGDGIGGVSFLGTNDAFTKNTVDGQIGFAIEGGNAETVSKNTVKNSSYYVYYGVIDLPDDPDVPSPSIGDSIVGNNVSNAEYGIFAAKFGAGPVNIQGNKVSNSFLGVGISLASLFDCFCPSDMGSTISGNTVSNGYVGFFDLPDGFFAGVHGTSPPLGSENSVWSGNTASGNEGPGFLFEAPMYETITGNTAKKNGDSGFYLEDNDPTEGLNAHVFSNNKATGNGWDADIGYGFAADYPQAGSGNSAKGNLPFDCYNIACSTGHAPVVASPLAVLPAKLTSHTATSAHDAVPAWARGALHVG